MMKVFSSFSELVQAWEHAVSSVEVYKKEEMELRKQIVEATFSANGMKLNEGANSAILDDGTVISVTQSITRKVDEAAYRHALVDEETFSALFTHKPSLSVTEYRKLNDEQRFNVDKCLITSPGAQKLVIKHVS